jgi:hypothetical protein
MPHPSRSFKSSPWLLLLSVVIMTLFVSLPVRALDVDNDAMDDAWETAHGLDPASGADVTADPDADGLSVLISRS